MNLPLKLTFVTTTSRPILFEHNCTSQAWIKFQTLPQYMLRRHVVLLIEIRPSDGDVKPGGPLGAFREEQAMIRHRISPSPFLSSFSLSNYHHHHLTLVPHVMWSAQAVSELKIDNPQRHLSTLCGTQARNSAVGSALENTNTHRLLNLRYIFTALLFHS